VTKNVPDVNQVNPGMKQMRAKSESPECQDARRNELPSRREGRPRKNVLDSFGAFIPQAISEMEADLGGQCARRDVVRPAERREEVVNCILVGDIDGCKAETPFVAVATEQIVIAEREVK
jgi:hypothetical protein